MLEFEQSSMEHSFYLVLRFALAWSSAMWLTGDTLVSVTCDECDGEQLGSLVSSEVAALRAMVSPSYDIAARHTGHPAAQ
eukprot:gene19984-26698_t